jgi:hypothetical protein
MKITVKVKLYNAIDLSEKFVGSSNIQNNFALKLTYMCLDNHG